MTEPARAPAARRPAAAPVFATALALFVAVLLGLALQLRAGHDPSLGAASTPSTPRPVLVRRVEERVVITRLVPPTQPAGTTVSSVSSSGSGGAPASASLSTRSS